MKLNRLLITFLLIPFFCFSQEEQTNTFLLGARAGITATQVAGDGWGGFDKIGLLAGLSTEYAWTEKAGFETGIQFLMKGSQKNANPDVGDFLSYKLKLNYVEIPVLYKYYQDRFHFDLGLGAAFLLSSEEIDQDGIILDTEDTFNRITLNLQMGMNVDLTNNHFFTVRFTNSLTPIRSSGVVFVDNTVNFWREIFSKGQYNTVLEFGYKYRFK